MASVLERNATTHTNDDRSDRSIPAWKIGLAVVFLVGAFTLLFRLESAKTLGSHEGYAIIPAREMLQTSDYVVPRFGELPRLKKPPLIYWTIVGSAKITGQLDIWSARLPVALTGLLLGALIACWAWRWYGGIAAVGAAAAQLTSAYVFIFGRKCEADLILVLLITAALGLVVGYRPGDSRRSIFLRWTGIWSCVAISWLGKFHFAPAMILVPAVAWLALERRWRFLVGAFNPVGLAILTAAVVIWPVLVLDRLPEAWAIWHEETIGRAVGEMGRQPLWFYLPHLATWTLPWTLFAFLAWPASWRDAFGPLFSKRPGGATEAHDNSLKSMLRRVDRKWQNLIATGDPGERFLWVWLIVTFAIVTISANKHPHYILPALPAFSLWTGRRFVQLQQQAQQGHRLVPRSLAIGISIASFATMAGLVLFREKLPENLPFTMLLPPVAIACIGVTIAGWLLFARRNLTAAAVATATWSFAFGAALLWTMPAQDHRRGAYHFAEEARQLYGADVEIGIFGIEKDAALWYLGEPSFREETIKGIARRLEATNRLRLLTISSHIPALGRLGDVRVREKFHDKPGFPIVELGHYRDMVLLELERR